MITFNSREAISPDSALVIAMSSKTDNQLTQETAIESKSSQKSNGTDPPLPPPPPPPSPPPGRLTKTLVICIIAAVFGSSFQFGYNNSVLNTPEGVIKAWLNATGSVRFQANNFKREYFLNCIVLVF